MNVLYQLWTRFRAAFSRAPDFVIGDPSRPYMLRWYVIPRNRFLNLYLHKFLRDDDDRALHDHPWWFVSLVLRGCYLECLPGRRLIRRALSIAFRWATDKHRIELPNGQPCWTLVMTGPKTRVWGFWCPQGFVPWDQFVDPSNSGAIGPGCGE